ncbi:MAG: helicase-related protein [Gemmatimonadota bacterium]
MIHPVVGYLARSALRARALHPVDDAITIGRITLLPHQVAATHWLRHRITRYGGALLADPPGLGKTYVALALAAHRQATPLIIAPAALRDRWRDASTESGIGIEFVSTERLSAPRDIRVTAQDFVIIDEAHHLRTASTRRYQRTASLCATGCVLLLSATPIHNHPRDVARITALFHLPITRQTAATLRRLTLRRTLDQIHAAGLTDGQPIAIPAVSFRAPPVPAPRHPRVVARILEIPPLDDAMPHGHRLLQLGLLHALRSSDAACQAQVRNRIAATIAIEDAARAQVEPGTDIRRAFTTRDGDVQLALAALLGTPTDRDLTTLAERAASQRVALRAVLPCLDAAGDRHRVTALRRLARWCRHPVVAFTQFAATAHALYRALRLHPGIALLSGAGARIASGVVSRTEVLDRLLAEHWQHHHAIRLLITTDVLCEGLSLAGVATIVHLDLPWTAARIDQRIGRAARIGAPVPAVTVTMLPASVPADLSARLHTLLAGKRRAMDDFIERTGSDTVHVALLRQLSRAHAAAPKRWVTMRSAAVGEERIVALVRIRGRRMLVVAQGGRLRAPRTADWYALRDASESASRPGAMQRLQKALATHEVERELCEVAEIAGDRRLHARRRLDHQLLGRDHASRIAGALQASREREEVMRPTRVGAELAAAACEARVSARAPRASTVTGRHVNAAVVLVPA